MQGVRHRQEASDLLNFHMRLNYSNYTPIPAEAEFDGLTAGLGTIQLCL
jgi:hypothetical protein